MGGVLIEKHFAHGIELKKQIFLDDGTKYRLLEHDTSTALNSGTTSECQPRPGNQKHIYLDSSGLHRAVVLLNWNHQRVAQQIQNICRTFTQCWTNVGPTL